MEKTILKIEHLSKSYHDLKDEIKAIDDITLEIKEGEIIAIVGPSGCGKSSLLSILSELEKSSSGNITFDKENLTMGYMLQKDSLFPWKTILENCLIGTDILNITTPDSIQYIKHLLKTYGLGDFMDKYPSSLSGGMRQRVGIFYLSVKIIIDIYILFP